MSTQSTRYDATAIAFHWIVGVGILAQLVFGWSLGQFLKGSPERALAINLHKSTGLVLALLIVMRLLWRLRHRAPPYAPGSNARLLGVARVGHILLYVCMLAMPITGYLASNFSKHGIKFFNAFPLPPWGPDDKNLYALFNGAHDATGFAFSVLVAAHIGAALYHGFIARDGVLARMAVLGRRTA